MLKRRDVRLSQSPAAHRLTGRAGCGFLFLAVTTPCSQRGFPTPLAWSQPAPTGCHLQLGELLVAHRKGLLQRLSKGVYYRPRQTTFGRSLPNPAIMRKLASRRKTVFPSGIAAANLLGFTTQMAGRGEVATSALSLPRKLIGNDTVVHTRRPETWASLSDQDAALLYFLRRAGSTSELSEEETLRKTLGLFSEKGRFERLLKISDTEPPRVRAIMGAIGEEIGKSPSALKRLKESLNPFSRFDFGALHGLRYAGEWQARDHR